MNLRNIEYVLSIAETGSFSKSAKHLYISQPALSQAILRLEDDLGVKLFIRRDNETALTRAGELFVKDAKKILMISNQIKKKMEDIQQVRDGRIVFGVSQYNGQIYFSKIFLEFKKRYPNIKICIVEDYSANLERELLTGKLDFAMFTLPMISDGLAYEHLFCEEILLAVPPNHPINATIKVKPDQFGNVKLLWFKDDNFILMKPRHRFRMIQNNLFLQAGFEPKIVFESRSGNTIQSFITGGVGVGFITVTQQRNTPREWQSTYYHLEDIDARREHVIAYSKNGYLSHAAIAFISLAKELCAEYFNYQQDLIIR